mmetsp:Transcript_9520/g.28952  ORF Transcript_9520/g.28952 Transcript_9520/m.28952 type:complete len:216 (-) Transcript_9520:517-1164(-)
MCRAANVCKSEVSDSFAMSLSTAHLAFSFALSPDIVKIRTRTSTIAKERAIVSSLSSRLLKKTSRKSSTLGMCICQTSCMEGLPSAFLPSFSSLDNASALDNSSRVSGVSSSGWFNIHSIATSTLLDFTLLRAFSACLLVKPMARICSMTASPGTNFFSLMDFSFREESLLSWAALWKMTRSVEMTSCGSLVLNPALHTQATLSSSCLWIKTKNS